MSDNNNLSNSNQSLNNENEILNTDLNNTKLNKSGRELFRTNNSEYRKNNQRTFNNPHPNNRNSLPVSETMDGNYARNMGDRFNNDHSFQNSSHSENRNKYNGFRQPLDNRKPHGSSNYNSYNRKDQYTYDDNKFSEKRYYGNEANKTFENVERRFDNREQGLNNYKYQDRSQQYCYDTNKQANSVENNYNDYNSYKNTKNVCNYRGKSSNRGNTYSNNIRPTYRSGYASNDYNVDQGENRKTSFQQSNKQEAYKHETKSKYYNNIKSKKDNFNIKNDKMETTELNQRDSLIKQLSHNQYECMICVVLIRPEAATWSCDNCYHIYHLNCIKKWASTCDNAVSTVVTEKNVRCPTCQKEHELANGIDGKQLFEYRCFCNKMQKPVLKRGIVPHSCDEVCEKPLKTANGESCVHLCSLLCHPGPCPPCEATVTRSCHCGITKMTTKCTSDSKTLVCGSKCDKVLNCGLHRCQELCHANECNPCVALFEQRCCCDLGVINSSVCGSAECLTQFSCGAKCGRVLNCGNHKCDQVCHTGPCESCVWSPSILLDCWCAKYRLEELLVNGQSRQSCLDPVPSCGEVCGKLMPGCGHACTRQCHDGSCEPCPLTRNVNCRCGKSTEIGVPCDNGTEDPVSGNQPFKCSKMCNKKLQCGRHQCAERCCDAELHLCFQQCARVLRCKIHNCERECGHKGPCPPCLNASFDELHCECGSSIMLPPIPCGQKPPGCNKLCSRTHSCDHAIRHNCHSEESCPPCTELVSKSCPGGHRVMNNIPCFRPVATCGLECGRPLSECEHHCIRICHQDNCVTDNAPCSQPCSTIRNDCNHPCAAPCHTGNCQSVMSPCSAMVTLLCLCKIKSVSIACTKLQNVISLIKFSNSSDLKRDNLEIIISPHDESVSLACDAECKKFAREIKLADAFNMSITTSNLSTYYSNSLKSFAKNNIDFLLQVEKILLDLSQKMKKISDVTYNITIKNLTEDKTDFVNRYSTCFKMTCKCSYDQIKKWFVIVEVNRMSCCLPKPLLSELLKSECPQLFQIKADIDNIKTSSTSSLTKSFADRIRMPKKE